MLNLGLCGREKRALRVLCIGAHCDDIEIGCGGTVLTLLRENGNVDVHWVVLSAGGVRGKEAMQSARRFLAMARRKVIILKRFRDGFFPYLGREVKEYFSELRGIVNPDIVFTHFQGDRHQDHRLVSELTWNSFRDHLILEYEVIKYDGDLGSPNLFVHVDARTCKQKCKLLSESFRTQSEKQWFDRESFMSVMRLRGIESRSPSKYAEAFYCKKTVAGLA